MRKLGIFGGTFSPSHIGHLKSALAFYDSPVGIEELYIMPTAITPHKEMDDYSDADTRISLLERTFSRRYIGERNIKISRYEIEKADTSYTSDTVSHFASLGYEVYFLLGSDMLLSFDTWHLPDVVAKNATLVLARRENELDHEIEKCKKALESKYGARIIDLCVDALDISSSDIRKKIASGEDVSALLTVESIDYIKAHGLYGDKSAISFAEAKMKASLSEKRAAHCMSVKRECERIADIFALRGKERHDLLLAAILHDITHEKGDIAQFALCSEYDIPLDENARKSPRTLHALTGAAYALDKFSPYVSKECADAIRAHTTGDENMTLIAKIVCLADFIEETRPYDDCKALRDAFYRSINDDNKYDIIDAALFVYFDMTIKHVEGKGYYVNETTKTARDFLLKSGAKDKVKLLKGI